MATADQDDAEGGGLARAPRDVEGEDADRHGLPPAEGQEEDGRGLLQRGHEGEEAPHQHARARSAGGSRRETSAGRRRPRWRRPPPSSDAPAGARQTSRAPCRAAGESARTRGRMIQKLGERAPEPGQLHVESPDVRDADGRARNGQDERVQRVQGAATGQPRPGENPGDGHARPRCTAHGEPA